MADAERLSEVRRNAGYVVNRMSDLCDDLHDTFENREITSAGVQDLVGAVYDAGDQLQSFADEIDPEGAAHGD